MNDREVFALMKLVEEGVLTSDQSRRVLEALRDAREQQSPVWDQIQGWTKWIGDQVGRAVAPQKPGSTLTVHVHQLSNGVEISKFQVPLNVFLFFKGLLQWLPSETVSNHIDFQELYKRAEEGRTGVVWEKTVEERGEKITVIIE